jgi:hypothetical protein
MPSKKQVKEKQKISSPKITLQMVEVAKVLGDVTDKRYDYEIASEAGIASRTIAEWKTNPDFMAIVNGKLEETKAHIKLNAYKSLNRQAIAQNMVAVKEALDRTEGQTKQKHEHTGEVKVIFQNSNKILSEADKV